MPKQSKPRITVRRWTREDIPAIAEVQRQAYRDFESDALCSEREYEMQWEAFPEGQLLAETGGRVIGYAASLIVQLDTAHWHSYSEITGDGTFSTHEPSGDTLYGADIAVHPDYRGRGVAKKLYEGRKRIMQRFNLRRMVAGGRIPGYKAYAGRMTAEEYVDKVIAGEMKDPALNAHLRAGYEVKAVHLDYLQDASSLDYATHLELKNPDFRPEKRRLAATPIKHPVRLVRVCAAQYQMRRLESWEDFERQVNFFCATADEYHCHFLLFPELFTCQLFSIMDPNLKTIDAMHELADYTSQYETLFKRMTEKYAMHIIAGSHPVRRDGLLYNVAHLFTPSGNVYTQDKLHITPAERIHFGIQPGHGVKIFDTGLGRIGIQVCYDIEFPEIPRIMTLAGAEILFVPFSTDERKAYLRVKYCAQARAVENWIYTVIAGNIGNLPDVRSFLINYGQAAIYTPSDVTFPPNATAAQADPNTETVVMYDLDLSSLALQREMGSVRPLRDRRMDMYETRLKVGIEHIRTF
jgi:predicted amidohydrolase/ribosomal protein S18 acetylase RimI-like enzyme